MPGHREDLTIIALLFSLFFILLVAGIPIAFTIGLSSLGVVLMEGRLPGIIVISKMFAGMDSFPLMAIPFFILTGTLANAGGLTERIFRLANALVGHRIRAGLAHVNIVASMIFAGISGSVVADSSAMGSMLIPGMTKAGFDKDYSVAVTATSSTIGALIPPSVVMVIYGFQAEQSIGQLFLGGAIPGFLVGLSLMVVAHLVAVRRGYKLTTEATSKTYMQELWDALRHAGLALVIPVIIIGGIVGGVCTPTEAGVLAAASVFLISGLAYRTLTWRQVEEAFVDAAVMTAVVMLILGVSAIFANIMTRAHFQTQALNFLETLAGGNTTGQLFVIMAFLFFLGLLVDVTPILIMFGASLGALCLQIGYDPIHFGVVIVMTTLMGACTPPVGMLLILDCGIAGIRLSESFKVLLPFVGALYLVCILVALFPALSLFLPRLLFGT